MQKFIRGLVRPNTFLPAIVISAVAYLVAAQTIPQNTLAIVINGLFIAMAVMVNAAYGPTLIRSLRSEVELKEQFLVSGILLVWNAVAASRMWSLALILAGKPEWMINHWFQSFCYFVAAAAGFYFIKIPGASRVGYKYTTLALILAIVIITSFLVFVEY